MSFVFPCPSHHIIFVMPNTSRYIGRSSSLKPACLILMQASQPSNSTPKSCLASWWSKKSPVPLREALGSQQGSWLQYPLRMVCTDMDLTKLGFSHLGLMAVGLASSPLSSPCNHRVITAGITLKPPSGWKTVFSIQQAPCSGKYRGIQEINYASRPLKYHRRPVLEVWGRLFPLPTLLAAAWFPRIPSPPTIVRCFPCTICFLSLKNLLWW